MKTDNSFFLLPAIALLSFLCACNRKEQSPLKSEFVMTPSPVTVLLDTVNGYNLNQLNGDSVQVLLNGFGDTIVTGRKLEIVPDIFDAGELLKDEFQPYEGHSIKVKANRNLCDSIQWSERIFPNPDSIKKTPVNFYLQLTDEEKTNRSKKGLKIKNSIGDTVLTCTANPYSRESGKLNLSRVQKAKSPKQLEDCLENIQLYSVEQGLPNSSVFDVEVDDMNHLWICTMGGVTKFNGSTFTHIDEDDGLLDNVIYRAHKDKDGRIYLGTRQQGFSVFNGDSLIHFENHGGLLVDAPTDFLTDSQNRIWVTCYGRGLSILSDTTFTVVTQRDGLWGNKLDCIFEDSQKRVWIGGRGGLTLYQNDTLYNYHRGAGLSANRVFDIAEDKDGNIWFATYTGLSVYDGTSFIQVTQEQGMLSEMAFSLCSSSYGMVIGTDQGVYLYRDGQFFHYGEADGIPTGEIPSIVEDKGGNIWICHNGAGLFKWRPNSFSRISDDVQMGLNTTANIVEDFEGNYWFGTSGYGTVKYDGHHLTKHDVLKDSQRFVRSFLYDSTGMNAATWGGGMCVFGKDGMSHRSFVRKSPTTGETRGKDYILSILKDKTGRILYGTDGDGMYIQSGNQYAVYNFKNGMPSEHIRSIKEDQKGNIWIGSNGFGIIKLKNNEATCYTVKEGMGDNYVYSLLVDHKGRVWAGTENGGLCMFDGEKFVHYNERCGLPSNTVWALTEDDRGRIFAGTTKGLACLTPAEMLKLDYQNEYIIRNYDFDDGMQGVEFYENGLYIDAKSNLWCGIKGGLSRIPLNQFDLNMTAPTVRVESVDIGGRMVDFRNPSDSSLLDVNYSSVLPFSNCPVKLCVPFSKNHLTFKFGSDDLATPNKVLYSFKLSGQEDQWSAPTNETTIDYLRLQHGEYVLMIRAAGASGLYGPVCEFAFEVSPPWWHTWWARLAYIVLLVLLMVYIIRKRTEILKARAIKLQGEVDKATVVIRKQKEVVEAEKKKSDELLLNILPEEVAEELKEKGVADAKLIDEVTVMFTDFKGFTQISEKMTPTQLVALINDYFSTFDRITQQFGIEKIKTIGDSYMAAGGLPTPNGSHPEDVINAALELQRFMQVEKARKEANGEAFFEIRIGIHTGPVVAGIVGIKKFAYDIWGDTVNTASRMESSGEAGKVNISGTTYEAVKNMFKCTFRGKVEAKGKGQIDMYFVEGPM